MAVDSRCTILLFLVAGIIFNLTCGQSAVTKYTGSPLYKQNINFYQLGNDMVPGMNTFDMGLVAHYIECFYISYTAWLDGFMSTARYTSNGTFYDSRRVNDLYLHLSELPHIMTDPVEMLDAMLKTTGYNPANFSHDAAIVSEMNYYYSQKNNGIDRPELIFFRSLYEILGDGLDIRFGGDFYADNENTEIRLLTDSCAPFSYTSTPQIMPTMTSWYPSSSQYSQVYFYQLGNDMVPGMNTFDMGLVAHYIECFYISYTAWLDGFMSTARYTSNGTFYDSRRVNDLYLHLSELPHIMTDPVEMLDAMLKTTGYNPANFSHDAAIVSEMNYYYSQKNNGIDRPELIFFRSLYEILGDGLDIRFGGDFYADNENTEIRLLTDSCAPFSYTSTPHIMPTMTSWYPSSSQYSQVYFYQLGNDMVPGMNTFDMGLVAHYIECFYMSYTAWLDGFMSTARYTSNGTFYDSRRVNDLYLHLSELPHIMTDPVEMLDAMLKTTGYNPVNFSQDSAIVSEMNYYYSQKNNGIDRPELIFFRSLYEILGDGLDIRFGGDFYADNENTEIRLLTDSCAPFSYTSTPHIMPTMTSWYPSSSQYPKVYFYQLGNDMVPGMNTFDMGLVAHYIECFYMSYTAWLDGFMSTARYTSNGTFYDSRRVNDLYLHFSELPHIMTDPVEMLDAMLKTTGYNPANFSQDSAIVSEMNFYYSQKNNGIDRPELIFFRSLYEILGDGLDIRFGGDFYADNENTEIRLLTDSCAPFSYTSTPHIMPTMTSWYPSSSQYSKVYFYQLGNDMVPGMNTFDMGLVAHYIECFYMSYTAWLDGFMSTARYTSNRTFYDSRRVNNLYLHLSELPHIMTDPVEMLDAMLKTTGYNPANFSHDAAIVSEMNYYYSQKNNGIDGPELIFFRSLYEILGDGLDIRFGGDFFADNENTEIRLLTDSCAPFSYTSTPHIMPTMTSWYPSSSQYPKVYFYQLGNDMVPGMNTFDMGLVAHYIECFYMSYTAWLDGFMSTARYTSNGTFYDSRRVNDLYLHFSELPHIMTDPVEILDAMLKTTGYNPANFSHDSAIVSEINYYYSQKYNGIDRPELIFFRSLHEILGDGLDIRFGGDLYADNENTEIRLLTDSCAPFSYTSTPHIMPTMTSWYPSSSKYPKVYFYQLGNDMVPGMNTFDMGLVAHYIECFYTSYTAWLDWFMSTARYTSNGTFYDSRRVNDLYLHLSELPHIMTDPVEMLDAMLKTTGYNPANFSQDSAIVSEMNFYYSQKNNGIDRPELIFFRSLHEILGDGLDIRFGGDLYADNENTEIRLLTDSCAPFSYMSTLHIMPTMTSWYPSSSQYSKVYFYQLGNDMVPGMNTFDMGLVAHYVECFYMSYTAWLDGFMSTARYTSNGTFYDSRRVNDLYLHLSELPHIMTDPVEMLDAMLKTTGYNPANISHDSAIVSEMNYYYSQKNNGIDRPELIFFRSLYEILGDGLDIRFGGDFYADNENTEIRLLTDSCAPFSYMSTPHIMPTMTSWYPSSSQYSKVYFYQLGNDMVPGMNSFDMGLVAHYIECFYMSYTAWLDGFMSTARYTSNGTFYDSRRVNDLYLHLSELPHIMTDPVEMLDAMLKTTGYNPANFSHDSAIVSEMNYYYSQKNNGIDRPELIFFRSLHEILGDGLDIRFGRDFYADNENTEIRLLTDSCAPFSYTSTPHIMPTMTSWYPSSSQYSKVYFYQLGNDMVPGMNTFDMGLVAHYIECFYMSYTAWLDGFMSTARYTSNGTFYDSRRVNDLYLHLSELPHIMTDPVEMLDAMLKTTGYNPANFSQDSAIVSEINYYYSQKNNGIDRPELIFFRSLHEILGDGLDIRFGGDFYADNENTEIRLLTDSCAPFSYTSTPHIMPTMTSWYPSSSQYSKVYFYQLGNDMVPGMNTFDMGLVAHYVECFYMSYTAWLDGFMSTARYTSNGTFYDSRRVNDLYLHLSELPHIMTDPVEMLDAMLKTTGYNPANFSHDSAIVSEMNYYYSQKNNGIDRPELIFFRSLYEILGDGLDIRFGGDFYADNENTEIRLLTDSCAPFSYTSTPHIMPTMTSWYPSSSQYSKVYFYQLGNDMVPGMNSFDIGLVAHYIECFYMSYTAWLDGFMSTARYTSNGTFYDSRRVNDLYLHLSELPHIMTDPVEMLDAMLKTTGYNPANFSHDSAIVSEMNYYYSQKYNGIDRPELIFFRSLYEILGDGLDIRFGGDFYADNENTEIRLLTDSCAPFSYTSTPHIMPTMTSWYPSSSKYPKVYFYQLGNDMVPGMNTFDMGLVAHYIECFYTSYTAWLDWFMSTARYTSNGTFYDSRRVNDLYLHLSELPHIMTDPVEMLDAMLKTTGYNPANFSQDSAIVSEMNYYYSQKNNGIDRPELIFFRSLHEILGDGLDIRFGGDLYADNENTEIRLLTDSCAPFSYMSTLHIMPTMTSWYPSSSQYSKVYFYQLGNDMVPGMNTFDMGLVAHYVECFYMSYTAWLDGFMSTARYTSNGTFYDSRRVNDLYLHLSELPHIMTDPVEMLDAMLKTTGYNPANFSHDSVIVSEMNYYYSQKNNGIDRPELIFFRSLYEILGDGLDIRFGGDFYADNENKEIRFLTDSCAPFSYTSTPHIKPTMTSWYPSSSQYSQVYFYQLGNDMVPGMNTFDMGLVAHYIECFYISYTAWLDGFMSTARYTSNGTFYDSRRVNDLYLHLSELPHIKTDPVEMLDAMLKSTGYNPANFSHDSAIVSEINYYYSQKYNGIDRLELIFFRSLYEILGDGLDIRFGGDFYADNENTEIRLLTDSCAPFSYTSTPHIMPTMTSWYPSSSQYSQVYFYQLGNDMVPGMNTFDMGLVAHYIECFYISYTAWLDGFMSTARYTSNGTFYDSRRVNDLYLHLSELPHIMTDPVEMLDAMLKTTGYNPANFSQDSAIVSEMNYYYSQKYNGIDRPELIFFRSLYEILGDGLDIRFGGDFYADNENTEIRLLTDSCAPFSYTSTPHIMPTMTSWYPSSSQYSQVYFYQLGNDMVPGMNTFDMGLVAHYIECFYISYTAWLDGFMSTARYTSNGKFYDSRRVNDLYLHLSELPHIMTDPVEMLDAMLKTTGYNPANFSQDSAIVSEMNYYYSQKYNGIDRPELIFFRSLYEILGDGLDIRFGGDFYADNENTEIRLLTDSCAPFSYTSTPHIMPTMTSWYPSSSQYSQVYFYQLGNDMVPGMNTFDMGLVAHYIECFYISYTAWLDGFISTARYTSNGTFYDSRRVNDLYLHLSELPHIMTDPVEMLDAMLKTTGYNPANFSHDSAIVSEMNYYYSQKYNGIDRPELIFFRSLYEILGDGLDIRFGGDFYADNENTEIRLLTDSCAPFSYTSTPHIMPTMTSWYPSSSKYPKVYFYQLGNDMVPGMNTFDMGLVAHYIECFYTSYTAWLDWFMSTARYTSNGTFYDSRRVNDLYLHLSELPHIMTDPVEMLDAMLKTTGYNPANFSQDSAIVSEMNFYYSQKNNGIDRPELIFFRSLHEILGDGLDIRFGGDLYADNENTEIRLLTDSCAPFSYMSTLHIMPTMTSWYPSSSQYSKVYFYQLGNDMVPGMNTFDMGLVAHYVECFYMSYTAWLDGFMSTARYTSNGTFYDSRRVNDLYLHLSELPHIMTDPVEMLDAMLKTTGYNPANFSHDSAIVSEMNYYYSQKNNGIDRPELIFFRSLYEILGDGLDIRFGGDFYADNENTEIRLLTDSCAPFSYMSTPHIMPTMTSWYPSSSQYSKVYFYQLGNDMVPGMNSFDMGLVAHYIECFYMSYTAWLDGFMSTARYTSNGTFYDSRRVNDLYLHLSELPHIMTDPVEMLDAMLKTTGYNPANFSHDSAIVSEMNYYYSQKYNGIDRPELIFFRSLYEILGDGLDIRFGGDFYADNENTEIRLLTDSCAPFSNTSTPHIMPTMTSWYPSSSKYPKVYFYQLGNDMVPGMNTFDMGLVAHYIECFYTSYTAWLDGFMSTARYTSNGTFYDSRRVNDLYLHLSELPHIMTDPVEMLDAMLKTTGYNPANFSQDSAIVSEMNFYYSQKNNGIDRPELIFFRSLYEILGDGLDIRFGGDLYADNENTEIRLLTDSCAPFSYMSTLHIMPTMTSWYPSSSQYSKVYFYQLGNDMVPGMNTFDMGLVAHYIECFYMSYTAWLDGFMSTARYTSNGTFYDSRRVNDLYLHLSELPHIMTDPVEMLDAMLKTTGYNPANFSHDAAIVSEMNYYYSQKYNGIDRPELIFFRSLYEILGDGLDIRFGWDFYADNENKEIRLLTDSCAPFSYTSTPHIKPTMTSWYPSSSQYSQVYFYQLGNDMVPGMNSFDMGLVAHYIECFYISYTAWLDGFMSTARYTSNGTFYDSRRVNDLYLHLSELPHIMTDPVEMIDAMLKTTGYNPANFSQDSAIVSEMNYYYSQKYNGIDRPELIFFRSLYEILGDGLDIRFGEDFYADNENTEIRLLTDSCAPFSYTSTPHIMPTMTSWYPSSSQYSQVYFYQLGNDMVPGMNTFDMGLVAHYIECFYISYTAWLDGFMSTARYTSNGTFYDSRRVNDLYLHLSELPHIMTDPVEMLDAMLKTTGYNPAYFSQDSAIVSEMNYYYSQKYNGIDRPELIFFRSLYEILGDGLDIRFGGDFYADNENTEIRLLTDSCAPFSYTSTPHIMPTMTSWYPSSSQYSQVYFYQLGNDMVPGMNTFDMGLVAHYIECFYISYTAWLDGFISTARYTSNGTFYDSRRVNDLYLHLSELPHIMTDPVEMLDAMLKTTGYNPANFSQDSAIVSEMNYYYSQKYNGIDRPELIFFRSLYEILGDGLDIRFGGDFYADNENTEIRLLTDSCAPFSYTSTPHIMPTMTSWYPSSSQYSQVYFYQLGNDMVPGMNTFDMGLVAHYIECFYISYTAWLDGFMSTARYTSNGTFYDSRRVNDLYFHLSELPHIMTDPVEMLDAMLKTTGYNPANFSQDSAIISEMNYYYSQKYNGIDRPELIFFRSLYEILGDGLDIRFGGDFYADNENTEIRLLTDSCAPFSYTSTLYPTSSNLLTTSSSAGLTFSSGSSISNSVYPTSSQIVMASSSVGLTTTSDSSVSNSIYPTSSNLITTSSSAGLMFSSGSSILNSVYPTSSQMVMVSSSVVLTTTSGSSVSNSVYPTSSQMVIPSSSLGLVYSSGSSISHSVYPTNSQMVMTSSSVGQTNSGSSVSNSIYPTSSNLITTSSSGRHTYSSGNSNYVYPTSSQVVMTSSSVGQTTTYGSSISNSVYPTNSQVVKTSSSIGQTTSSGSSSSNSMYPTSSNVIITSSSVGQTTFSGSSISNSMYPTSSNLIISSSFVSQTTSSRSSFSNSMYPTSSNVIMSSSSVGQTTSSGSSFSNSVYPTSSNVIMTSSSLGQTASSGSSISNSVYPTSSYVIMTSSSVGQMTSSGSSISNSMYTTSSNVIMYSSSVGQPTSSGSSISNSMYPTSSNVIMSSSSVSQTTSSGSSISNSMYPTSSNVIMPLSSVIQTTSSGSSISNSIYPTSSNVIMPSSSVIQTTSSGSSISNSMYPTSSNVIMSSSSVGQMTSSGSSISISIYPTSSHVKMTSSSVGQTTSSGSSISNSMYPTSSNVIMSSSSVSQTTSSGSSISNSMYPTSSNVIMSSSSVSQTTSSGSSISNSMYPTSSNVIMSSSSVGQTTSSGSSISNSIYPTSSHVTMTSSSVGPTTSSGTSISNSMYPTSSYLIMPSYSVSQTTSSGSSISNSMYTTSSNVIMSSSSVGQTTSSGLSISNSIYPTSSHVIMTSSSVGQTTSSGSSISNSIYPTSSNVIMSSSSVGQTISYGSSISNSMYTTSSNVIMSSSSVGQTTSSGSSISNSIYPTSSHVIMTSSSVGQTTSSGSSISNSIYLTSSNVIMSSSLVGQTTSSGSSISNSMYPSSSHVIMTSSSVGQTTSSGTSISNSIYPTSSHVIMTSSSVGQTTSSGTSISNSMYPTSSHVIMTSSSVSQTTSSGSSISNSLYPTSSFVIMTSSSVGQTTSSGSSISNSVYPTSSHVTMTQSSVGQTTSSGSSISNSMNPTSSNVIMPSSSVSQATSSGSSISNSMYTTSSNVIMSSSSVGQTTSSGSSISNSIYPTSSHVIMTSSSVGQTTSSGSSISNSIYPTSSNVIMSSSSVGQTTSYGSSISNSMYTTSSNVIMSSSSVGQTTSSGSSISNSIYPTSSHVIMTSSSVGQTTSSGSSISNSIYPTSSHVIMSSSLVGQTTSSGSSISNSIYPSSSHVIMTSSSVGQTTSSGTSISNSIYPTSSHVIMTSSSVVQTTSSGTSISNSMYPTSSHVIMTSSSVSQTTSSGSSISNSLYPTSSFVIMTSSSVGQTTSSGSSISNSVYPTSSHVTMTQSSVGQTTSSGSSISNSMNPTSSNVIMPSSSVSQATSSGSSISKSMYPTSSHVIVTSSSVGQTTFSGSSISNSMYPTSSPVTIPSSTIGQTTSSGSSILNSIYPTSSAVIMSSSSSLVGQTSSTGPSSSISAFPSSLTASSTGQTTTPGSSIANTVSPTSSQIMFSSATGQTTSPTQSSSTTSSACVSGFCSDPGLDSYACNLRPSIYLLTAILSAMWTLLYIL